MIRVTIQMVPNGDETQPRLLGTILIQEMTTTEITKPLFRMTIYNLIDQVLENAKFYKHEE